MRRSQDKSAVLVNHSEKCKKKKVKRINYSENDVKNALKAVQDTGISVRRAATAYGVPETTLRRKRSDPSKLKAKSGPGTVMSVEEETEIVQWVLKRADLGAPVTKTELFDSVQKYVETLKIKTPFTHGRPSRHWYERFRKRHPELSIRKPQHLSTNRATVSREDLQDWFRSTEKYLREKNLLNISSTRFFNCDETSVLLCPDSERVLAEKGSSAVYKVIDGGKEAVTVLFMYRADGTRAPPMLMYAYKRDVPKKILDNTPAGWGIGVSESGWMTAETFFEYICNVFYPWLVKENTEFPVVIFMDNHSSHLNLPLVSFCREKRIELIMLTPNSTHITQPLDISFFHPFKESWKKSVPKWKNQEGVMRVRKEDFPLVLKFAIDNMRDEKNVVMSGFRASGLYPFDPKAVDYNILKKKKKLKDNVEEKDNYNFEKVENTHEFFKALEASLSVETLSEFHEAAESGPWTGELRKEALFNYWFGLHKKLTGITLKQKPVIQKIENVNNLNIKLAFQNNVNINQPCSSKDIDFNTSSLDNVSTDNQELHTNVSVEPINLVDHEDVLQPLILVDNNSNTISSELVKLVDNEEMLEFSCEVHDLTNQEVLLTNDRSDFLQSKPIENLNQHTLNDHINLSNEEIQLEYVNPNINQDHQMKPTEKNIIEQENGCTSVTNTSLTADKATSQRKKPLQEIFTLPVEYLPKKKRIKIEKLGRPKLPSAGTSDAWYECQLEKENIKKEKEEKQKIKKRLQEEKKKIMEQLKEIQKKIKEEK